MLFRSFLDTGDAIALMVSKATEEPLPLSQTAPNHAAWSSIVMKALAPAPDQRWTSAGEFAHQLYARGRELLGEEWLSRAESPIHDAEGVLADLAREPGKPDAAFIDVLTPNGQHHRISITDSVVIGREADITVDDPRLSRHHVRMSLVSGVLHLEDLGSTNGTSVNGRPLIDRRPLRTGDEVLMGDRKSTRLNSSHSSVSRMPSSA